MLAGWWIAWSWWAVALAAPTPPWADVPGDPAAARGAVVQQVLPELSARRDAATARARALGAVLAGKAPLAEALPDLAASDLQRPELLDARLLELDAAGVERSTLRRAALPEVGSRSVASSLASAWTRTLDAESAADEAERRVLYALRGWLDSAPAWRRAAVDADRSGLDEAYRAAVAAVEDATEAERPARLARVAALDAARVRWSTLRDAARGQALTGETPAVGVAPELADLASGDPVLAEDARHRAARLAPWVSPDDREALVDAELGWLTGPARQRRLDRLATLVESLPTARDPDTLQAALDAADARLAALAALPPEVSRVPSLTDALATLRALDVQVAEARRQAIADLLTQVSSTRQQELAAEAARKAAEEANAAVGDHPAVQMRAESRSWTAAAYDRLGERRTALTEARDAREAEVSALAARAKVILEAQAAGRSVPAGTSPDEAYAQIRGWITRLRSKLLEGDEDPAAWFDGLPELAPLDARREQLRAWGAQAEAIESEQRRTDVRALLADTRDALDQESAPLADAQVAVDEAHRDRLEDLRRLKALKHRLRGVVSVDERRIDLGHFTIDLIAESRLFGLQTTALLLERAQWIAALPALLLDFAAVSAAVQRLLGAIVLLVVWLVVRRRRTAMAQWLLDTLDRWVLTLSPASRAQLLEPMEAVVLPVIDAVAAAWLAGAASRLAPELGITLRALAWTAVFGALSALSELLVTPPGSTRPGTVVVEEEERTLMRTTWRWLGAWWVASYVVDRVLSELMFADALGDAAAWAWWLIGFVLAVLLLVRWDDRLLPRVRRMGRTPGWLGFWLKRDRVGLLTPVRSLLLGGYLSAAIAWDVAQGRAAQQDGYNALVSVMDRVRFVAEAEEAEDQRVSLDPEVRAAITADDVAAEAVLARPKIEDELLGHVDAWRKDRRRGVVVLTGDRGDGKRLLLERVAERLAVGDQPVRITHVHGRMTSKADALAFFAEYLGLDHVPTTADAIVAHMATLPEQVHVLRRTHRAFVRRVHGFDALRTLLYVCNATSERHFWVLGIHRPAWGLLSRVGTILDVGVVRAVVDVAPLTGTELRKLVTMRLEAVGIEADFRRLENTGPFGAPPDVERERAIQSYFRLLAEASGGCAGVALELVARSLRPRHDGKVDVVVIPELATAPVDGVDVGALFVLAALRMHERLTLEELCAVLPGSDEDVKGDAQQLVRQGLVVADPDGLHIAALAVRPVSKTLKRRHILQWAG